jgi:glycyl-tRNA synthetase
LDDKAKEVAKLLRDNEFDVIYDETGSIGKRYARVDEIGVVYSITIDYDTLKNADVTIRFRNDGKQIREKIASLPERLRAFLKENKKCL